MFQNETSPIRNEFWFIPLDLIMLILTSFVCLFTFLFLLIIFLDKTCRSVSTLLLCNSFLSEFLFASVMFSITFFTFRNDIKQIIDKDRSCSFRGYLSYATSAIRSHSYLLQSIYRYIKVVYPSQIFYQSQRFQLILICLTWILSIIHPFPFFFTNQIEYNVDNQVCHMPFQRHFWIFYTCFLAYLNPILIITIIYFKLVRYVHNMSEIITPINRLIHARRQLQLVRRIAFLVIFLVTLGLPYTIFYFLSFVRPPPRYHFRIAFFFVDLSLVFVILVLFQFTNPIRTFLQRQILQWTNESTRTKI
ncbi:unnamed protein product [Adineta ricciae]|uniref:G-protein coupled receptors family 1 profile domain-containing protein n=1 Tax=Adineta ricciae TaxID=249248 RepID=A0A815CX81_ADIRI|nr:unnamed protein product [Adineta ricciae]CAF1285871.1 unnamed protein product [Adineta ricciae]